MADITLALNKKAQKTIDELMKYYRLTNRQDLICKALTILNFAARIDKTGGELIVKKDGKEHRINFS